MYGLSTGTKNVSVDSPMWSLVEVRLYSLYRFKTEGTEESGRYEEISREVYMK